MALLRKLLPGVGAVAAVGLSLAGCNTSGCVDNRNSVPLAGFRSIATGEAISVDSLAVAGVGAPGDSSLTDTRTAVQQVYLPFRSSRTSTSFSFTYLQKRLSALGIADTVTFDYVAEPRFVSEECGAMYYYRITGVSHTDWLIDSVAVADSLVTNLDRETIRIYFRTADRPGDGNKPERRPEEGTAL